MHPIRLSKICIGHLLPQRRRKYRQASKLVDLISLLRARAFYTLIRPLKFQFLKEPPGRLLPPQAERSGTSPALPQQLVTYLTRVYSTNLPPRAWLLQAAFVVFQTLFTAAASLACLFGICNQNHFRFLAAHFRDIPFPETTRACSSL